MADIDVPKMKYRQLGTTSTVVSAIGLGGGGASGLGMRNGLGLSHAIAVAEAALAAGVTFFDTAPRYGTESVLAALLPQVTRDALVLSSKADVRIDGRPATADEVRESLHRSLDRLGTDYLDVLLLHGVRPAEYQYCRDVLLPALIDIRGEGLVRSIGLSESFGHDLDHDVARRALASTEWDVLMLGINVLDPSVIDTLSKGPKNVGVVAMHAARWALTAPHRLALHLESAARAYGRVDCDVPRIAKCLRSGRWDGVFPRAAYSFVLGLPGVSSVLTGTSNPDHLRANLSALDDGRDSHHELIEALRGCLVGWPAAAGERIDDPLGDQPAPDSVESGEQVHGR